MVDNKTLKSKTISAFSWSVVGQFGSQLITFAISVILARIISPAEFGMIGMLAILLPLSQLLTDFGFNSTIIQRKDIDNETLSSIFYLNISFSIFIYFLLFIFSGLIARFYNEPGLELITKVYCLLIIINSFRLIQNALLVKEVNFKTIVIIQMISSIIGGGVGIFLALEGNGVWSLVWQGLITYSLNSILLWYKSSWRPNYIFKLATIKPLMSFSFRMFVAGLIDVIYTSLDNIIIGRIFHATELGYYTRAKGLKELPMNNTTSILTRVVFPLFSSIKDDDVRLLVMYKKLLIFVSLISFPIMAGMYAIAEPLIRILFTDKWIMAVPYLKLFCLFGFVYPLSVISVNIPVIKGRADVFLKLEIYKKILLVTALVVGFFGGIKTFLILTAIASYIALILNFLFASQFINYSVKDHILDIIPYLIIAILMGLLVVLLGAVLPIGLVAKLSLQVLVGVLFFFGLSYLYKPTLIKEIYVLIKIDILKINGN